MQRHPAQVGAHARDIETPALIVDLDALQGNLERMATTVRAQGVRLRPHAKSHKCPPLALQQVALGAAGICCQKTDEAAAFVEAGITDVLVTNEVIAPSKLARLAALATRARIGVLCDDSRAVAAISRAAMDAGASIDVYVEVDVGAARCGVAPGAAAAVLAAMIANAPNLHFAGLQCYQGAAQHLRLPRQRQAAVSAAIEAAIASRDACVARGLQVAAITGAGTGTFELEMLSGVFTELQPGSYPFMDADYARNQHASCAIGFAQSLYVLTTVMSTPTPERAICDAGLKSMSFDSGLPLVAARAGLTYVKASDEHGVLQCDLDHPPAGWGERLHLVPGHCDPTVNLYDWLVGIRDERVECVWPVARGTLG
ncbi:MAG: DSD1 family PLP-dependent enzyme [Casimicrobiaceae bacterium]